MACLQSINEVCRMKRIVLLSVIYSVFLMAGSPVMASDTTVQWKAGVARVKITPKTSMWMAGYAARNKPSEGVRQDLWAKALVLEDSKGKRVVLVSTDLVGIRKALSERIRNRIEKQFGLTRAQVILNSSHTHTGPETESERHIYALDANELKKIDDYSVELENNIVTLVGKALKTLRPARLYAENGVSRFQVNRRNNQETKLVTQTELKGPNDFAVPVIKVVDKKEKIVAVLFGYACHNTVLGDYMFSGDYAGFAQLELEKVYPGAVALFFQGAGADQNPLPRRTPALAKQYGQTLAASVERVLEEKMRPLTSALAVSYSEINLHFEKPSPTKEELSKIINGSDYPNYLKHNAKVLLRDLQEGKSLITSYPYPIQVWKIGEQPLVAMGGEVVVGYSIAIKQIFGQDTFVFGYSNDVMAYIPTAVVLKEGGYEGTRSPVFTSPWASNIETRILNEVTRLANVAGVPEVKKVNESK